MTHIFTKEQYLNAKAAWKVNSNRTPEDHIVYNAIRGFDLKRGFTEITNPIKLGNGADPWMGYKTAKNNAQWSFRSKMSAVRANVEERYAARIQLLTKQYGIEFDEELMAKMREVLK